MKRLAIVLFVLVLSCGAAAAESRGFSIGAGALALVPVVAPSATGFGGGFTVGLPSVPVTLGLSVSTFVGQFSVSFDAEYLLIERDGESSAWYLGAGGMALLIFGEDGTGGLAGIHLPVGFACHPPAWNGLALVAELGLTWLPIGIYDGEFVFAPVYLLARPWLGVRWRF